MHIQLIIGSVRQGRMAKPVGNWTYQIAKDRTDLSAELIDLKDWNLPMFDLAKPPIMGNYENSLQQKWADKIAQGDGYLFINPEYNHGYTAPLKNALDYIYGEWIRKPASFVSYGGVNGARSVEQLRQVVIELRMAPLRNALHIPNLRSKMKDDQFVGDSSDAKQLSKVLDDLLWWGNALKKARDASEPYSINF